MTWDSTEAEDWITKAGFATVSVAGLCPPLLSLRKVRGDMIVRTPLSTLEKLIAPPGSAMLIGAQRGPVLGAAVEVLKGLGHRRGVALQGPEGSVVPFVTKRTRGIELDGDHLVSVTVEPADFGLEDTSEPELPLFGPAEDGQGSSDNPVLCQSASDTVQAVLSGEPGPARKATLLSAALMLKACGRCMTIAEGVDAATSALDSGAALERVARLRSLIA
jgi:anthranilate phosphoribosyltransferase